MATDMNRLQGEITENPTTPALLVSPNSPKSGNEQDATIERLIVAFLRSLLDEQRPANAPAPLDIPAYLTRNAIKESV